MQNERRNFLTKVGKAAGALTIGSWLDPLNALAIDEAFDRVKTLSPVAVAEDEDFWKWVRQCYTVNYDIINLNNGGVSPQPKVVQEAFENYNRTSNFGPSYYMWRVIDQGREPLRRELAELAGCSSEEVVVNRNATEALETIIFGLNLKEGDEVVLCKYDYPNMKNAWLQREKRDKIKLVWVDIPVPAENDEEIVSIYEKAFTSKTKVVHVTHVINWTGQILPVRKIADKAHAKGIEVLCDGAHSFAHIEYKIPDLDCDYFGTSLHKWLCAPFGSGMMFIKKEKIKSIWPLFGADKPESEDIRKFESQGTRSFATEQAIRNAIEFQLLIGNKRKEERLRFLKNYWTEKVKDIPKVKFYTSLKSEYSCALCCVGIEGMKPSDLESELFNSYKIHTTTIDFEAAHGVRITPHVYTSLRDLDLLVKAIKELAAK